MLEEVGKSILVRSLLNGSDIGGKVEFSPSCRLVIVPDVVGESVVQLPFPYGRIIGKLLYLRPLGKDQYCREQDSDKCKDTFHNKLFCICLSIFPNVTGCPVRACRALRFPALTVSGHKNRTKSYKDNNYFELS